MLTVKLFLVVSALCLGHAMGSRVAGCQGYQDCSHQRGDNCYKNMCLNATEAMKIAFEIDKPCKSESDCPEACMTGRLTPAVCGPYLRVLRLPGATHVPECDSKADCSGEGEECIVRPHGNECTTPENFMEEEFSIGMECQSNADCPEACYTAHDNPTCGPFLSRMNPDNPVWDDNTMG